MVTNEQRQVVQIVEILSIVPENELSEPLWLLKSHCEETGRLPESVARDFHTDISLGQWGQLILLKNLFHTPHGGWRSFYFWGSSRYGAEELAERIRRILICPTSLHITGYTSPMNHWDLGNGNTAGYGFDGGSFEGPFGDGKGGGVPYRVNERDYLDGQGAGDYAGLWSGDGYGCGGIPSAPGARIGAGDRVYPRNSF